MTQSAGEIVFKFMRDADADSINLADNPVMALAAVCVCSQQAAEFRECIDLRQVKCPDCGSEGFNSGWGYWTFVCGAEILTDGEPSEPCGKAVESTP